jgi:hypothetical protein
MRIFMRSSMGTTGAAAATLGAAAAASLGCASDGRDLPGGNGAWAAAPAELLVGATVRCWSTAVSLLICSIKA